VARKEIPYAATDDAAVDLYLAREIRRAQGELEDLTRRPFFVTHFCTEELAQLLGWEQGVDFDEIIQALSYDVASWRTTTGRTELPWAPIVLKPGGEDDLLVPAQHYQLALAQSTEIADVPVAWLQADAPAGTLHLLPFAVQDVSVSYFTLFGIHPAGYRAGLSEHVPLLIHLDYYAGIVERTAVGGGTFDPAAYPFNTRWPQTDVITYQAMIGKRMAGPVLQKIAPAIARGGVSLSIDGVSRSVNTQSLSQQAQEYTQEALAWAESGRGRAKRGPGWVFVGR
jgi:hypothetical protein